MGFSLLSTLEFFAIRKMEMCETKTHLLCGWSQKVIQKNYDLAHTKWECKYHIVFAMIFSITRKSLTTRQLAEQINVVPATIQMYEQNKPRNVVLTPLEV